MRIWTTPRLYYHARAADLAPRCPNSTLGDCHELRDDELHSYRRTELDQEEPWRPRATGSPGPVACSMPMSGMMAWRLGTSWWWWPLPTPPPGGSHPEGAVGPWYQLCSFGRHHWRGSTCFFDETGGVRTPTELYWNFKKDVQVLHIQSSTNKIGNKENQ
jgi:hypothetical protein